MPTQYIYDMTDTWDNGATTFTFLKANVTDTASAAASKLLDLQVGGNSIFSVRRLESGGIKYDRPVIGLPTYSYITGGVGGFIAIGATDTSANILLNVGVGAGIDMQTNSVFGWTNSASNVVTGTRDLILRRRGAANLAFGAADAAAPVAQTLSVQSVVAGTTNVAGANLTITGSQSTGSGAAGNILFQTSSAGLSGPGQNALATVATIGPNTLTGSETTPLLSLAQTWNTSGLATGIRLNVVNTASLNTSRWLDCQHSGTSRFSIGPGTQTNGFLISSDVGAFILMNNSVGMQLAVTGGAATSLVFDGIGLKFSTNLGALYLNTDAANTLALRNGTAAQAFRVYNTTDGTNSEFGSIKWNSNVLEIAADIAGTGTRRPIAMVAGVGPYTVLKTTDYGTYLRQIATSSGLNLYNSDANAVAAGSTGRVAYLEGLTGICLSSSFEIKFSSGADAASSHDSGIARSAVGVLRLTNASTGGGALQLTEMTAPAAPATNNVRIYAEDNGSGKTRIMALFPTGAAVQIAIEP